MYGFAVVTMPNSCSDFLRVNNIITNAISSVGGNGRWLPVTGFMTDAHFVTPLSPPTV